MFKNYIKWNSLKDGIDPRGHAVHAFLLERFPFVIDMGPNLKRDLRDIDKFTEYTWTAQYSIGDGCAYYYFKNEIDAVTIKLKFL